MVWFLDVDMHTFRGFNTVIYAFDNKVYIYPNGLIQSNGIANLSKRGTVRVDLQFGISYSDDNKQRVRFGSK